MSNLSIAANPPDRAAWLSYLPESWTKRGPVVPVLRLSGAIGMVTPLRPGLSLSTSASAIEKAFSMRGAKAVAIQINSPGGSPVQSMLIYKRIRALAEEKGLKVYVFAEDVAASGGYLLALAGDEIYADPSSIIGSIGVITAGFGLDKLIEKIGVERRVYTAGESKDKLDPFLPEKPEDVERIKSLQRDVHATFIDLVKERRGARIANADDNLFTGDYLVRQARARARPDRRARRSPHQDARCIRRGRAPEAGGDVDLVASPQAQHLRRSRRLRFQLLTRRVRRRSHLGDRDAVALVTLRTLAMPPIFLLVAAGAGLFFARRWYTNERQRVAATLRAAEEALAAARAGGHPARARPRDRNLPSTARVARRTPLTRRPLLSVQSCGY